MPYVTRHARRYIVDCDGGVDDILALVLMFNLGFRIDLITTCTGVIPATLARDNIELLFRYLHHAQPASGEPVRNPPSATRPPQVVSNDEWGSRERSMWDYSELDETSTAHMRRLFSQLAATETGFAYNGTVYKLDEAAGVDAGATAAAAATEPNLRRAPEAILSLVESQESGTYSIICMGPLTNLGNAISLARARDVEFESKLECVYVMGGNLVDAGFGSDRARYEAQCMEAEYNFRKASSAARTVLSAFSGAGSPPLVLLPLNVSAGVCHSPRLKGRSGFHGGGAGEGVVHVGSAIALHLLQLPALSAFRDDAYLPLLISAPEYFDVESAEIYLSARTGVTSRQPFSDQVMHVVRVLEVKRVSIADIDRVLEVMVRS